MASPSRPVTFAHLHVDARILLAKPGQQARQDVDDGGFAGGDHDFAGLRAAPDLLDEPVGQFVDAFHQGPRHVEQFPTLRSQFDARAAAFEERRFQGLFQRLDLQAHGGLAEKQLIGCIRHFARSRHRAECAKLLQRVPLVVKTWCFAHKNSGLSNYLKS